MPNIKVIGLGSPLRSDDGLGIEAIRRLAEDTDVPPRAELIDGGLCGVGLLDLVEGADAVILIDAVRVGDTPPGSVVRLSADRIRHTVDTPSSSHDLKIGEVLRMAEALGIHLPPITLLGIVPENVSQGEGLSKTVENAMPKLISAIRAELS